MKDRRTRCALIATLMSVFAVALFALPGAATPISEDPSGFAQHLPLVVVDVAASESVDSGDAFRWPYNQQTPIAFSLQDITAAWETWKTAQITANNAGGGGRLRVMGGVDARTTVSEGQAYGMLFASLFDEQATFDGLWLFARDYLDEYGLMHWHIGDPGQVLGTGAATDGDADMALALINACIKVRVGVWAPSPQEIDYCGAATDLVNATYAYEVDHPGNTPPAGLPNNSGYELLPGDQWYLRGDYPDGIVNLSYFSPGYFTVFGKYTNNRAGWNAVNARNYEIVDAVQSKSNNCSGLVPNWNQYDGDAQPVAWQPANYGWWSYDAARFAWRIAVDRYWYNSAPARETLNEIGGFFSSIGVDKLHGEYSLAGTPVGDGRNPFFAATAGTAIWGAPHPVATTCGEATGALLSDAQAAYDATVATKHTPSRYYGSAWRLFGMLLMSGNFPNFYEMATE